MIDKLNKSKIEKFFHSENGERCMKIAGEELRKSLDEIHNEFSDRFTDYLQDEYSLFFADRVRDGIIDQVQKLLAGDDGILERHNLKPSNWGLRCDHNKVRRKIVEENADIIKDTYIRGLEEELERARESLRWLRESKGMY